jgi:hypothetical protein
MEMRPKPSWLRYAVMNLSRSDKTENQKTPPFHCGQLKYGRQSRDAVGNELLNSAKNRFRSAAVSLRSRCTDFLEEY